VFVSQRRLVADVQEQLGLRLNDSTAPVDVVVIDHMDNVPTKN
jgi:uncharacterized protein (TIGR03435 family)